MEMAEGVVPETMSVEGGAHIEEVAGRVRAEVLAKWGSAPLRRGSTKGIRPRGFDSTMGFDAQEGFGGRH